MMLALLTHDLGSLEQSSMEGLTLARSLASTLGTDIHAVLIGEGADRVTDGLGDYGATTVHLIRHDQLSDYNPLAWGVSLAQLIETLRPAAVVAAGTQRGNEVMAQVGAVLGSPMVANCVAVDPSQEAWQLVRTRWGGSLLEETHLEAETKLLTVSEHCVAAQTVDTPRAVSAEVFVPRLDDHLMVTRVLDRTNTAEGMTLATAPVVVSGGRGVGSPDGFAALEELAGLLGGVVGCSRVVTNNGWRPHSDQVGQTGTVVAPDLYIACGISGAIQHWVGMMASETVLAINIDAEAPMVTKADYAVLGDLHEVIPAIITEIRRRQAG